MSQKVSVCGVFPQEGLEPEEYEAVFYGSLTPDQALCLAFCEADSFFEGNMGPPDPFEN